MKTKNLNQEQLPADNSTGPADNNSGLSDSMKLINVTGRPGLPAPSLAAGTPPLERRSRREVV